MDDWKLLLETQPHEADHAVTDVEGAIPAELSGTFLRNGPGLLESGSDRVHLFDGHGQVAAMTFDAGRAAFRVKHVETPLLAEERAAGKLVKRRVFTNLPSRWSNAFETDVGNGAMHNVVEWGGTIVALQDQGWFALAPDLSMRGPAKLPPLPNKASTYTPMPRVDPVSGRLLFFVHEPGLRDVLHVHEIDREWNLVKSTTAKLPRGGMLFHDIAATSRHYVTTQWGSTSLPGILWGAKPMASAIVHDANSRSIVVVPKSGAAAFAVPIDRLAFHVVNAFEKGERLFLDVVAYDGIVDFSSGYPAELLARYGLRGSLTPEPRVVRYEVDLHAKTAKATEIPRFVGEAPEVPEALHGRPSRYAYFAARTVVCDAPDPNAQHWLHGVGKVDFETRAATTWGSDPRVFCSAPAFVPRDGHGGEDDGFVLVWLLSGERNASGVAILDAKDLARGPLATLWTKTRLGYASHVSFTSNLPAS